MASSSSATTPKPTLIKIKHLSIVRLDRNDYFTWKVHTMSHLCGYELLQFIEKSITVDGPSMTQQDQLLLAWLFFAISTSLLPQVIIHKTSYKLWVALGQIFNTKLRTRILHLRNQLQNFKKDDLTVVDYISKLTMMAKELREAGVTIEEGDLSLIILNGLDPSYDYFVTAEMSKVEDMTLASLLGLLLVYEARLNQVAADIFKGVISAIIISTSDI